MENSESNNNIKDKEQRILENEKLRLTQKAAQYKYSWKGFLITWLIGFGLYLAIGFTNGMSQKFGTGYFILFSAAMGLVLEIYYLIIWGVIRMRFTNRLSNVLIQLNEFENTRIQEDIETNFFTKLVQLNFKYLDKYYLQTQIQADKSFGLSLFAALFALLIISVGIGMMFLAAYDPKFKGDPAELSSYVVTAAGILSEFIAAVFFYLYNKTIQKMSEYHQKLVLTQNISLALKISEGLPDDSKQTESQQFLIKELTKDVNFHLMNNGGLVKTIDKQEE